MNKKILLPIEGIHFRTINDLSGRMVFDLPTRQAMKYFSATNIAEELMTISLMSSDFNHA
jgi:hypothetical protein